MDLAKAYDMISWNFSNNILIEVGIPYILMNVIITSIKSIIMSVLWNGENVITLLLEKVSDKEAKFLLTCLSCV